MASEPVRIEVTVKCRDLKGHPYADEVADDLRWKIEAVVAMWRLTDVGRTLHADPVVEAEVVRLCCHTGNDGKGCLLRDGHLGKHWPTDTCYLCGEEDTRDGSHLC